MFQKFQISSSRPKTLPRANLAEREISYFKVTSAREELSLENVEFRHDEQRLQP